LERLWRHTQALVLVFHDEVFKHLSDLCEG